MPKFYMNPENILVSTEFIEKHMPKANATFVKIYLYALYFAQKNETVEYASIAQDLNLLESDVIQAFNYWQEEGVLTVSNDSVSFDIVRKTTQVASRPQPSKPKATRPGYTSGEVATAIADNSNLSEMVMLAQEILGKTLNPTDTETLYWFYEGLKFSPEVILMLLEYCVSKEKRRMAYIEKVAIGWHERGITSMDAVNNFIEKEAETSGFVYSIRKALGITDRALSQNEEQFINRWHEMYNMDESMISYAYEQCIMQTAKLSFPYMEKILERWYKQGIHTVAHAQQDNENFKNSQTPHSSEPAYNSYEVFDDGYDHEALEELTRRKFD